MIYNENLDVKVITYVKFFDQTYETKKFKLPNDIEFKPITGSIEMLI